MWTKNHITLVENCYRYENRNVKVKRKEKKARQAKTFSQVVICRLLFTLLLNVKSCNDLCHYICFTMKNNVLFILVPFAFCIISYHFRLSLFLQMPFSVFLSHSFLFKRQLTTYIENLLLFEFLSFHSKFVLYL